MFAEGADYFNEVKDETEEAIKSFVEICNNFGLDPKEYLEEILEKLIP